MARHGESTWNVEGRYQGRRDPPLSILGLKQAEALAARVGAEDISAVFSSPLTRSLQTATNCVKAVGLDVIVDERLTEISHGAWEGRLKDDVARTDPAALEGWLRHPERMTAPGGETLTAVKDRLEEFWSDLSQRNPAGSVLAVTHDVIVRLALLSAQRRPLSDLHQVEIDNASLTTFELNSDGLSLLGFNEVEFLGGLRSRLAGQAR